MSKPTVFRLAGESKNFVFSNLSVIKDHAKVLFVITLVLEFLNSFGAAYGAKWVPLLTFIPSLLVYACFALSWHRVSLVGTNVAPVDPFKLEKPDWSFIGVFFGLVFLPLMVGLGAGVVIGVIGHFTKGSESDALLGFAVLALIPLSIWGIIILIRLGFILPARSVGVNLTYAEAKRSSKGLIWPLLGSGMLFGLMYMIPLMIYGLIVAMIVGVSAVASGQGANTPGMELAQFVVAIPIVAAGFILTALNVTALSRAYQWGIRNNPIEVSDS